MVKEFDENKDGRLPRLGASSLPSLVFAVLFFFVVMASVHRIALGIGFAIPRNARLRGLRGGSTMSFVCMNPPASRLEPALNSDPHVRLGSHFTRPTRIVSFVTRRHAEVVSRATRAVSVGISRGARVNVVASVGRILHGS